MKSLAATLAAAALVGAPVLAQTAPNRAPVTGESEVGGGSAGIFAAAMIAGIVTMAVLVVSDDDDQPTSP